MLSIGLLRDGWRSDPGGVYLRQLLIGALCAPIPAAVVGRTIATPFGLPLGTLAGGIALVATGYVAWRLWHGRGRGRLRVVIDVVTFCVLATVFALIIGWRATGFYTQEALADSMAVLLMIHLGGASLRAVGLRGQRWPRMTIVAEGTEPTIPQVSEPASMQFADKLTVGMAALVASFWGLAVIPWHEAAGVMLLLASLSGTIALVVRAPSALFNERVLLRRWRRSRRHSDDRHRGTNVAHS